MIFFTYFLLIQLNEKQEKLEEKINDHKFNLDTVIKIERKVEVQAVLHFSNQNYTPRKKNTRKQSCSNPKKKRDNTQKLVTFLYQLLFQKKNNSYQDNHSFANYQFVSTNRQPDQLT
ncbi:hypothetical protein TTHERM_00715770 (macronuclear) [Tetrahymena thermophila SB210]|uniref:Uncharacterized protein n=1 Tax=Tetrahymena thermophila (strain SB210) TaxID=312017 RepID=I7LZM3_TETTS|nr:hypothetical protein TTHERM_00715770 [Tetrahymena thermophila SB210]EAR84273.1 hypothetical protein TTHERM_00715770 [Tetrahymena thermophila SB210]|eukprot:XP_001031936.1 hypothetical protein TTHERM_00715770 [Tetrahymena thermophila SB210]